MVATIAILTPGQGGELREKKEEWREGDNLEKFFLSEFYGVLVFWGKKGNSSFVNSIKII